MGEYGAYEKIPFTPNLGIAWPAAIALEAAAGVVLVSRPLVEPIAVTRFGYQVEVAFDYDTQTVEGVLTLYRYPGGDANAKVALATIPLKDVAVVNGVYYVDVDNVRVAGQSNGKADFSAGDQVAVWISTQGAGGGAIAGDFQPCFCFYPRAEVEANQPLMHDLTPVKTPV